MIYVPAPPLAASGSLGTYAAFSAMCATTVFTWLPEASVINSPQVVMNYEMGGFYSQRTGKWYPASRQRIDGMGRIVGDDEMTDAPVSDSWDWNQ